MSQSRVGHIDAMEIVDALGLKCPLPVLRLRKALERFDLIELRADDPMAQIDVPHFCAEAGHTLLSLNCDGTQVTAVVRRRGS